MNLLSKHQTQELEINADLHIAEVPYESGAVRFRYARKLSEDRTRWIRHGLFIEYAKDGSVLSEGQYQEGKEDGLWQDFHPNGKLAAKGVYQNGVEVGVWHHWADDGSEEPSTTFPLPSAEA